MPTILQELVPFPERLWYEIARMFVNAAGYELFMGRCSRVLASALLEFARVDDGWHILDVGSGTGSLALEIAKRKPGCRITGIDLSPEYVAYASSRLSSPAVRFEVGNAQSLPYPAGQFDASLSLLAFNFVPDPHQALAEVKRVTRSGGHVCAAVGIAGAAWICCGFSGMPLWL